MVICPACHSVHEEGGVCTSSRHESMNSFVLDTPATAIGNSNPLELNARTIQQLITANLTLAEAWTWIEQLTRNESGNVTAFPLIVTSEIYTIGFDAGLMNVLPNMTVENSGNSSLPAPPTRVPSYWERMWNSFTGLVSAVWNAVVAVATFIANVALAVVKWCIDFAVAIANGEGLEFFYETVVKPFVEALLAFIRWIIDMVVAVLQAFADSVLKPALAGVVSAVERVITAMSVALQLASDVAGAIGEAMMGALPVLLLVATIVILIVAGVGWAMNFFPFVGAIILGLIALILMVVFYSMIPDEEPAFGPDKVESSLEGYEAQWGTALWLFGLVDISLGKIATAFGSKTKLAVEWEIIIGFVFVMTAFVAGGIAEGCDGKEGACAAGIFALAVSGLAIILSANAVLSAKSGLTGGQRFAYFAFTGIMALASLMSFLANSGYVFKNCR